jgi:NDP-sugar pyrophosphorylase family protein
MLDYAAALLQAHGIDSAVVNAHWLPDQVQAWADAHPMDVHVSTELPDVLGTGGGLKAAAPHLAERFVIVNGDILCDVDVTGLLAALDHAHAAMALRPLGPNDRYGVVSSDRNGVVDLVGLATRPTVGDEDRSTHFTGVHAMRRETLERVPDGFACIVRTAYTELVAEGRVAARRHAGTWFDVGTPQAYLAANLAALDGTLPLPLDPHARAERFVAAGETAQIDGATLVGPVWMGAQVQLAQGARIGPRVVLGNGSRVGVGASLRDSVVWAGCEVPSDSALQGAIVYDDGVLTVDPHA